MFFGVENAFTFVEVVMAALVVGLLVLFLLAAFSSGFGLIQASRENLRATQIILQRMEAVRLFNWKQVLDTTNYLKSTFVDYYDPLGVTNNHSGALYQGFLSNSISTNLPTAYRTNMRTLTVTLYWTNYNGKQVVVRSRQAQTQVARNGMQHYIWGAQ